MAFGPHPPTATARGGCEKAVAQCLPYEDARRHRPRRGLGLRHTQGGAPPNPSYRVCPLTLIPR
eukprot:1266477-Prymnesium_polylepis.1